MGAASGTKTYEEWVVRIGEERYREACRWAWRTAAGTGGETTGASEPWPRALRDVPHDLADVWHEGGPIGERLRLALRFYDDMPCYANTMYLKHGYEEFGRAEKAAFWDAYRAALDAVDDRLADPVGYSLWVDFFEDPETVGEAWRETTRRDRVPFDRRLRRVLKNAGPARGRSKTSSSTSFAMTKPGICRSTAPCPAARSTRTGRSMASQRMRG